MVIYNSCCPKPQKAKWLHLPLNAVLSPWGLSVDPLVFSRLSVSLWENRSCKTPADSQPLSGSGPVGSLPLAACLTKGRDGRRQGSGGQDLSLLPFGSAVFIDCRARCLHCLGQKHVRTCCCSNLFQIIQ